MLLTLLRSPSTFSASWSGDGLAAVAPMTTSSTGLGDKAFQTVSNSGANISVVSSGGRPPRVQMTGAANTYLEWITATALGAANISTYAVRFYLEISAIPAASYTIVSGNVGATTQWRVDLAGTGGTPASQVRLRNTSAQVAGSLAAVPVGQVVRVEVLVNAGVASVTVYDGDTSTVVVETISATITGTTVDNIRFGNFSSGVNPTMYLDDFAVSSGTTAIGAFNPILASWSGDGLSAGTLTTATVGTGDTHFDSVAGTVAVESSGTRAPRIAMTSGNASSVAWTSAGALLGDRSTYAIRCYFEMSAYGTNTDVLNASLASAFGPTWRFQVNNSSGGSTCLRDGGGLALGFGTALALNTLYRIEVTASAGTITATVYAGHTNTVASGPLSGTAKDYINTPTATVDTVTFGTSSSGATQMRFDDIVLTRTSNAIGPAVVSLDLIGTSSLTATGARTSVGTASLAAGSTLVTSAFRSQFADTSLTASSSLSTAGIVTRPGAAALVAGAALSVTAIRTVPAAASLTADSAMSTTGVVTRPAVAALAASSVLSSSGLVTKLAVGALTASSQLTALATRTVLATAVLTASSALSSSGVVSGQGTAALQPESSLSADAVVTQLGEISLYGTSVLVAAGAVATFGNVDLAGDSLLTAGGLLTGFGDITLAAYTDLFTEAQVTAVAYVAFGADSSLTTQALLVLDTTAALVADSALSAAGTTIGFGLAGAELVAASNLFSAGGTTRFGAASLAGSAALTTSAVLQRMSTVVLTAESGFSAAGGIAATNAAPLLANASLVVAGQVTELGVVSLAATSTFGSAPDLLRFGIAALAAISTLSVSETLTVQGVANLLATTVLTITGRLERLGDAALVADSNIEVPTYLGIPGALDLVIDSFLEVVAIVLSTQPTWSYWDGSAEVPLTLAGEWTGSTVRPFASTSIA